MHFKNLWLKTVQTKKLVMKVFDLYPYALSIFRLTLFPPKLMKKYRAVIGFNHSFHNDLL